MTLRIKVGENDVRTRGKTNTGLGNLLLERLSRPARNAFVGKLTPATISVKQYLYRADQVIPSVYFPIDGIISLVMTMGSGEPVEITTLGREGMSGIPLFLGSSTSPLDAFCQVPGTALCMSAEEFRKEVKRWPELASLLRCYTHTLLTDLGLTAACSRLHAARERCARWLLMTHDRVARDEFLLTQEFIAQMLGVRRATVTETAAILQKAGLIRYRRGKIAILDRKGLEDAACECYATSVREYEKAIGKRLRLLS